MNTKVILGSILVLVLGGSLFLFRNYNFNSISNGFDPMTVAVGDKVGNFVVASVGPLSKDKPFSRSENLAVQFSGSAPVEGTYTYYPDANFGLLKIAPTSVSVIPCATQNNLGVPGPHICQSQELFINGKDTGIPSDTAHITGTLTYYKYIIANWGEHTDPNAQLTNVHVIAQ